MRPLVLVSVAGLTPRHIGPLTPHFLRLLDGAPAVPLEGVLPAVTCTAQASILTGKLPCEHGIVGNGWLFRDTGEVRFWLQSNRLIQAEPLYARARRLAAEKGERFTAAKLFWWYNQGAAVDWSVTPKPFYGSDGSKEFAIHGAPADLPRELERELGPFPFPAFWGPEAGIASTRWIARATGRVLAREHPTLTLAYLPHLDYDLQRKGPEGPHKGPCLQAVDAAFGEVLHAAEAAGAEVVVVSEYGLRAVERPVFPNRHLREAGLLVVREGPFGEELDLFASRAFAVCDHQVAHLHVRDEKDTPRVQSCLEELPGVARILDEEGKRAAGLDHPRAGDRVLLAEPSSWFAYPFWLCDERAPDFARTVDIHRKPGYDPCELFYDPELLWPRGRALRRLAQKKLGLRYRMDVVPLDATLVRGSHGLPPEDPRDGPVLLTNDPDAAQQCRRLTDVADYIVERMLGSSRTR